MYSVKMSVVMPLYNAEAYLEESIQSFLEQSLWDSELLCVDDGSTDSTLQLLSDLQRRDSRIKVFAQCNQGAGLARNAALSEASGKYIAFLDSDDYYPDETTLKTLYELAERHKTKAAGGSLLYFDEEGMHGAAMGCIDYGFHKEEIVAYRDFQQAYYYQRFVYSREMIAAANISFPPYRRFQDVVFFIRAMLEAGQVAVTDKPAYVYRRSKKYANLSDEQVNDMLLGYADALALARANSLDALYDFLTVRLADGGIVQGMVDESCRRGNTTALERYRSLQSFINNSQRNDIFWDSLRGVRKAVRKLKGALIR